MVTDLVHRIGNPDVALTLIAVTTELPLAITEDPEGESSAILQQATKTDKHQVWIEVSGSVCQEVRQLKVREERARVTAHGIKQGLSLLDALGEGVAMGFSFLAESFWKNRSKEGFGFRVVQQLECGLNSTGLHPGCARKQEADLHPVWI